MANPNIAALTTIYGKTAYLNPSSTSANVLLANAASSGKVFKINSIIATNVDGTLSYSTTVQYNTAASGSGTSYQLASTILIPANSTLVVSDKSTGFYLEEDRSILVTSSTASKISYIVTYEEIT